VSDKVKDEPGLTPDPDFAGSPSHPVTPSPRHPLRISLLDSATVPHGSAFWARGMAEQLARRGHRVTLFCPPRSPLREPPPGSGVILRSVPLRNNYDLLSVATLVRHLRRERVDAFLFQGTRGVRIGGLAAYHARVPGVVRFGSGEGLKATAYDRWIFRTAVARFIANAASIQQYLAALPWVGPDRVSLIYNGIDRKRFRPTGRRNLRQQFGIADGVPVLAVVARLQALKGHEDLLRSLPAVWERFPELHVLLAGQGPHEGYLRDLAQRLDTRNRVRFLGHCEDVRPVLEAADLFALPSHKEGLPNSVLEAMAMGLPVVATDAGGTGEIVGDGETGLLVPPGAPSAIAGALCRLLDDNTLRSRLVEGAWTRLDAQFTLTRAVDQVEALLGGVVSQ
jgi:glycosyltransferase involved in cell wall biosynthesis